MPTRRKLLLACTVLATVAGIPGAWAADGSELTQILREEHQSPAQPPEDLTLPPPLLERRARPDETVIRRQPNLIEERHQEQDVDKPAESVPGAPEPVRTAQPPVPPAPPAAPDDCRRPDLAWKSGDRGRWLAMADHCADPAVAGLSMERYLAALPEGTTALDLLVRRDWPEPAQRRLLQAARDSVLQDLPTLPEEARAALIARSNTIPALRWTLSEALLAEGVNKAAAGEPYAADLRDAVTLGNVLAWTIAGWRLLDLGKAAVAAEAFAEAGSAEEAVFGRVLAEKAAGHGDLAETLACEVLGMSARLLDACLDLRSERQLAAYQAGDDRETMAIGEFIEKVAPNHLGSRKLLAWAAYRSGQYQSAARAFAFVYDRAPASDLAAALVESLQKSGDQAALRKRIAAGDTVLRDIVARQVSETALGRKQFDLAAASNPAPKSGLEGRAAWQVTSGLETRSNSGDSGLGRLKIVAPRITAESMFGDLRIGVTAVASHFAIGRPGPSAGIGGPPGGNASMPVSAADPWLPILTLRREDPDWTTSARLSSTPVAAAVGPRPTGSLVVTRHGDTLILTGRAFSEDVIDSLLSYGGLRNPTGGGSWGRVVESGGGVQMVALPADRVSLAANAALSYLDGEHVADNWHATLRGDAAYDIPVDGLDHLRVGPFLSWSSFRRDLSHYTFGQGGYYSPRSDARYGATVDAMTAEGRSWQMEAKASLSMSHATLGSSLQYPLDEASHATFAGQTNRAINSDASFRFSLLAFDRLVVSGFARASYGNEYRYSALGIFFTVPFEPRSGVFSCDLPDSVFSSFR